MKLQHNSTEYSVREVYLQEVATLLVLIINTINNSVLFYVMFLQAGAHSPLQSKEYRVK